MGIPMGSHPKCPREFSQAAKLVIDIAAGHVGGSVAVAFCAVLFGLGCVPALSAPLRSSVAKLFDRVAHSARSAARSSSFVRPAIIRERERPDQVSIGVSAT